MAVYERFLMGRIVARRDGSEMRGQMIPDLERDLVLQGEDVLE